MSPRTKISEAPKSIEKSISPRRFEETIYKDKNGKFSTETFEVLTGNQIKKGYEARFGKCSKFIRNNSPIDKYYKMYVIEPESKVFGGS